jgi:poly(3-hydroxybutyrate) depolymerase
MRRLLICLLVAAGLTTACTAGHDEKRSIPNASGQADGTMTAHIPVNATTTGVVVLHSLSHLGDEPAAQGWSVASDRHGFVALYPARDGSWNAGLCCGGAAQVSRDDVSWLAGAIADARARYHLTTIYLAGFSNGGMMVERLLSARPLIATRFAVWGAAPEMPVAGRWTGIGVLYNGAADTTVPPQGGTVLIGGRPTLVRPVASTGQWLLGAHLQRVLVPGKGHTPPPTWPELAWRALTAPPGLAPVS